MVLGLLALTDVASVLVHLEYTKLWPTKTAAGIVLSSDYSSFKLILFDWLFGFFDFMGRGFFVPLFCLGPWPLPGAGPATLGGFSRPRRALPLRERAQGQVVLQGVRQVADSAWGPCTHLIGRKSRNSVCGMTRSASFQQEEDRLLLGHLVYSAIRRRRCFTENGSSTKTGRFAHIWHSSDLRRLILP